MSEIVASLHGIDVPKGPHLLPNIVRRLKSGDYERPEIEAGLANLQPGDAIVEMGSGAGVVGAVLTRSDPGIRLASFEGNPDLIPHIRELYALNGLSDRIGVLNRIVVTGTEPPASVSFHIRRNFLGSRRSAENNEPDTREVEIATIHYDEVRRDHPHNVLVLDIEGAELEFLAGADLRGIDL
ncbi:MAG: FkbM family methyltransferase, partial [Actinomycetota bacterium]